MGLREFETADAKYYLGLGCHLYSAASIFEDVDFSKLDFMVFEEAQHPLSLEYFLKNHEQYSELYSNIVKENPNLPIYGVETIPSKYLTLGSIGLEYILSGVGVAGAVVAGREMVKKKLSRRKFLLYSLGLAGGAVVGSGAIAAANTFNGKYDLPGITDVFNMRTSALPTPGLGFRDAVVAKKIAEYLVPRHEKKPTVAILYGGMHSGIETKLKHKWVRDATVWAYHELLGYGEKQELNQIREIVRNPDGKLTTIFHDAELF